MPKFNINTLVVPEGFKPPTSKPKFDVLSLY